MSWTDLNCTLVSHLGSEVDVALAHHKTVLVIAKICRFQATSMSWQLTMGRTLHGGPPELGARGLDHAATP